MAVVDAIQPAVSSAGYIIETIGQVPTGSLGPNRVAAIFLSVPANLVDILNANPQTQMIVVSGIDLQTGPTLTVLRVASGISSIYGRIHSGAGFAQLANRRVDPG